VEMAGHGSSRTELAQCRILVSAAVDPERTAGMKPAAGRWIQGAWDFASDDDPPPRGFDGRIGDRYGREQPVRASILPDHSRHSRERGLMSPSHAVSLDLSRTKPSWLKW
jgi:hypothetical protein